MFPAQIALGKAEPAQGRARFQAHGLHAHLGQTAGNAFQTVRGTAHAPDHAVVLLAQAGGEGVDVLTGHQILGQHLVEHLDGGLELLGDDHIGSQAAQRGDLGDEPGAGHDIEVGVHAPGFQGDGAHARRVGNEDGQDPGRIDSQMLKDDGL